MRTEESFQGDDVQRTSDGDELRIANLTGGADVYHFVFPRDVTLVRASVDYLKRVNRDTTFRRLVDAAKTSLRNYAGASALAVLETPENRTFPGEKQINVYLA